MRDYKVGEYIEYIPTDEERDLYRLRSNTFYGEIESVDEENGILTLESVATTGNKDEVKSFTRKVTVLEAHRVNKLAFQISPALEKAYQNQLKREKRNEAVSVPKKECTSLESASLESDTEDPPPQTENESVESADKLDSPRKESKEKEIAVSQSSSSENDEVPGQNELLTDQNEQASDQGEKVSELSQQISDQIEQSDQNEHSDHIEQSDQNEHSDQNEQLDQNEPALDQNKNSVPRNDDIPFEVDEEISSDLPVAGKKIDKKSEKKEELSKEKDKKIETKRKRKKDPDLMKNQRLNTEGLRRTNRLHKPKYANVQYEYKNGTYTQVVQPVKYMTEEQCNMWFKRDFPTKKQARSLGIQFFKKFHGVGKMQKIYNSSSEEENEDSSRRSSASKSRTKTVIEESSDDSFIPSGTESESESESAGSSVFEEESSESERDSMPATKRKNKHKLEDKKQKAKRNKRKSNHRTHRNDTSDENDSDCRVAYKKSSKKKEREISTKTKSRSSTKNVAKRVNKQSKVKDSRDLKKRKKSVVNDERSSPSESERKQSKSKKKLKRPSDEMVPWGSESEKENASDNIPAQKKGKPQKKSGPRMKNTLLAPHKEPVRPTVLPEDTPLTTKKKNLPTPNFNSSYSYSNPGSSAGNTSVVRFFSPKVSDNVEQKADVLQKYLSRLENYSEMAEDGTTVYYETLDDMAQSCSVMGIFDLMKGKERGPLDVDGDFMLLTLVWGSANLLICKSHTEERAMRLKQDVLLTKRDTYTLKAVKDSIITFKCHVPADESFIE